jgi:phage gpG-like protein
MATLSKFNFDTVLRLLSEQKSKLPVQLGNIMQRHFKDNFTNQGFDGNKWPEVQRRMSMTKSYKSGTKSSRGNPILHGPGAGKLRLSLQIVRADWQEVRIETIDKEGAVGSNKGVNAYARVHNEGLRAGRGKGFIMPKRKFVGDSPVLNKKIIDRIELEFNKMWTRP